MTRLQALQKQAALAVDAQQQAEILKLDGRMPYLADDPDCPNYMRIAALGEEFGEACRALHDNNPQQLALEGSTTRLRRAVSVAIAYEASIL